MKKILSALLLVVLSAATAFAGSFKDNNNGTVTDLTTNLMWQQCSEGYTTSTDKCDTAGATVLFTWETAISTCESLTLGGFTDWRLPNIKELKSIADMSKYAPAINRNYFPNTQSTGYWSSTTNASVADYAWILNFYYGNTVSDGKRAVWGYVRCVRGQ